MSISTKIRLKNDQACHQILESVGDGSKYANILLRFVDTGQLKEVMKNNEDKTLYVFLGDKASTNAVKIVNGINKTIFRK